MDAKGRKRAKIRFKSKKKVSTENKKNNYLDQYFCASRTRKDLWNTIKSTASELRSLEEEAVNRKSDEYNNLGKLITELREIECYWAFPGTASVDRIKDLYKNYNWKDLLEYVTLLARFISTDHYRNRDWILEWHAINANDKTRKYLAGIEEACSANPTKPYFEILIVDSLELEEKDELITHHLKNSSPEDEFTYNVVVVPTVEDALIAVMLNYNIQSCILRYTFPLKSKNSLDIASRFIEKAGYQEKELKSLDGAERIDMLAKTIKVIRPEIDLYHLSESSVEYITNKIHKSFTRCFFGSEDYPEMRLSILKGVYQRYETPFFNALENYTQRPTGVFHALPISRSKSISKSHWIRDYGEFYGDRMFLAETSSTAGGLDSLLQPNGCLLRAQELAAEAFGSNKCLFVTNGTSTSNKIVLNAITEPEDIVLMAGDNHKSHFHAAILSGCKVCILRTYQIKKYGVHGGVPLIEIKRQLLRYKENGTLNRVKAIVITSLTFDGISYNLERLISECIAIKSDLIFIIDEAWFAYGYFTPTTNQRSAMAVARRLKEKLKSDEYKKFHEKWKLDNNKIAGQKNEALANKRLYPEPNAKIRVYSTQSTHKTLTALRQASMIHIYDESYDEYMDQKILSSYQTHTSTSPNYQILASLDIARRQVHFEGYELIQKAYELAFLFRNLLRSSRILPKYFRVLDADNLIPKDYCSHRPNLAKEEEYWRELDESWEKDEFTLDPTRVTLDVEATGKSGNELKKILMDQFDIQVNKTTRNTILIIIHIGATRGMVTYLLEALSTIANEIDSSPFKLARSLASIEECNNESSKEESSKSDVLELSDSPEFHPRFRINKSQKSEGCDIRYAAEIAKKEALVEYLSLDSIVTSQNNSNHKIVSATTVTPYPPGFPILLPGQVITSKIVSTLIKLGAAEIHGYTKQNGLLVFKEDAFNTD